MSDQKQQDQSALGVGRRRCNGKNHLETGSSIHKEESLSASSVIKFLNTRVSLRYTPWYTVVLRNMNANSVGKYLPISLPSPNTSWYTVVKNHECKQCGKTFTDRSILTQHILTHSGVKNYRCKLCEKTFTRKSNLTRHTLTHSGIKNYKCKLCETVLHCTISSTQGGCSIKLHYVCKVLKVVTVLNCTICTVLTDGSQLLLGERDSTLYPSRTMIMVYRYQIKLSLVVFLCTLKFVNMV